MLLALWYSSAGAQEKSGVEKLYDKVYNRFLGNAEDTTRKGSLLVLPALGYSPETKLTYGAQVNYAFYVDKKDKFIRPSSVYAHAVLGGNRYKYFKIDTDIWTRNNNMHYFADIKLRDFFTRFYGTGNETKEADRDNLRENKITSLIYAEKKLAANWYAGLRAGYEKYSYTDTLAGGIFEQENFSDYQKGQLIYFGLQQSHDTRNNIFSTTKGHYFTTSISFAPSVFSGNNFTGTILKADYRHFFSLRQNLVLGLNAITNNYFSQKPVPFYFMPQMGNDEMMRGYFQGRFRDENYTAAQAELRFRFIPRMSIAAFGGLGEVYGKVPFSFNKIKPNYGAGIRYFFDLEKSQSVRIDMGFGEKLPGEKRQKGVYFSLSEAF